MIHTWIMSNSWETLFLDRMLSTFINVSKIEALPAFYASLVAIYDTLVTNYAAVVTYYYSS
ncbi:hypothetical protein GGD38_005960 [Chitinophagaceae bacterium OAS944]|nr:hypothetical protein [Chitinophagaceae bacterium OAS944]